MKSILCLLALLAASVPAATNAQDDLLARMSEVNHNLHSYTASMKAHVAMTSFPPIALDIGATYYHKDPNLDKLEITSGLPGVAQQFGKLYPHIEPPSRWSEIYEISKVSDDGKATHFKLVPRKSGNVQSIDAVVDDKRATVSSMTWNYANGGTAEMANTYSMVQGYTLVTAQTGRVDEPSYKGTIDSTLSDYKINPQLPDSIFSEQSR